MDSMHYDTFNKISKNTVLTPLIKSLSVISNRTTGNVEKKYLREWARLCLFNNNTIIPILNDSEIDLPDYKFNFNWFYDPTILKLKCVEIFKLFDIKIINDITQLFDKFYEHNKYKNINIVPEKIISALIDKRDIKIPNLNFLQEAWIDSWLVNNCQITPVLPDQYFSTTFDMINQYDL
jgi:hypothetical protein